MSMFKIKLSFVFDLYTIYCSLKIDWKHAFQMLLSQIVHSIKISNALFDFQPIKLKIGIVENKVLSRKSKNIAF